MTTLRVGVVGGLTDDEIIAIRRRVRPDVSDGALWTDTLAFAREVERMGTRSLRDRVRELEAERDEQTTELSRMTVERAKLMNENERLRALPVALANGYLNSTATSGNDMHAIHIHYQTSEQMMRAHELLSDAIDAFIGDKP